MSGRRPIRRFHWRVGIWRDRCRSFRLAARELAVMASMWIQRPHPLIIFSGLTNGGPYGLSPVPMLILTGSDDVGFTVTSIDVGVSGAGNLSVNPVLATPGQFVAGPAFQLQFSGSSGFGYSVWASTNLTSWTVIGTGTFGNTPVTFTDTSAPSHPRRFYRISTP